MKVLHVILLGFLSFSIFACAGNQTSSNTTINDTATATVTEYKQDSFPAGKIIDHIACKNDPSQSYAIYVPLNTEKFTAVYFFDPHGDGSLPVKKYKDLADKYKYVLIGSNNSKNGNDWQTTENIWQNLFNDTQQKFIFDHDRIYTCGFSGGAKVASYIALHHNEVGAVIAGGAGLPDEVPAGNFNFSFTGIAGEGDMNMTDLVVLDNDFKKTQTKHRIIFFNGKHEWSPDSIMDIAFAGLQLDLMRKKFIAKNDSFVNAYIDNSKKRLNTDIKNNNLINAVRECTLSINMLEGISDAAFFQQKISSITESAAYKQQLQQQQNLFTIEQNKKAEYNAQFQNGDMNYWNKTINDLNAKAKAHTQEGAMYQRLLAYLSLAFYSISNQSINNNQNDQANYFVNLYKLADPTNSEAWYFSAVLNARNNNATAAHDDLLKAVANGFNDEKRMMLQPEFINLQSQINLPDIELKMHQQTTH
jgi:predicted esterase